MKIIITRNTFWDGVPYETGAIVDASERLADELMAYGKAMPYAEPEKPATNRSVGLEVSEVEPKVTKRQWRKKSSPTNTED